MRNNFAQLIVLSLGFCATFSPSQGYAQTMAGPGPNECFLSPSNPSGNCTPSDALTSNSNFFGARSDNGKEAYPIDINAKQAGDWRLCRYVDNVSSTSYFVPFHTKQEWQSLVTDPTPPDGLTLTHCARKLSITIYPGSNCPSPSPASATINLPYVRYYVGGSNPPMQPPSVKFTCTWPFKITPQTWVETATVVYSPMDSDVHDPSWQQVSTTYTGTTTP